MNGAAAAAASADAGWSAATRAALARVDARLARRFDAGTPVQRLLALRARAVDLRVRVAWSRSGADTEGLALFATGGYGRGELFPQSDIDVLVLADPDAQEHAKGPLARFHTLLWDAGLQASLAVRSPAQCAEAADDVGVLTALMEARPLCASPTAADTLCRAIGVDALWSAADYFRAKREELQARHARFGDTSDNLEPNIKEGPGGLRDLQTLEWLALRTFGRESPDALVGLGHVGGDEIAALRRERAALSRLRYGLHLQAARREERLRFDHQKPLATRLGFRDAADALAVEQMMQGFYRSATVVRRLVDRLLQRFEEFFEGAPAPEPIDGRFERRGRWLSVRRPGRLRQEPGKVLDLFAAWAGDASLRGLHSETARELAEALPWFPSCFDASPALRARFLQILRAPAAVSTLERMARLGVLAQWIPAFQRVSGRMQFDLFHAYTVDQHTLAVLRNIAGFAEGEADPRFSTAREVWPSLRKPELLLLAGLFHDIGKGRGGDHSELGAVDARAFCETLGLSEADVALVEWLVRHHLLMSVTAQKQDITDPDVIQRFATLVADRQRLDHLYLLTCADIAGTSPKLWNSWKDRLLADLHGATRSALRRGLGEPVAAAERIAENRAEALQLLTAGRHGQAPIAAAWARMPEENFLRSRPEQIAWQTDALMRALPGATVCAARVLAGRDGRGGLEVLVHMRERDGLFAAIVIALDRLGMGVLQARVLDGPDDTIFDTFHVLPLDQRVTPDPDGLAAALARALAGDREQARPARRHAPAHLRHFRIPARVELDEYAGATRISLVCNDRPGLLADVASVLRQLGLRVHDARIATFGERAEDLLLVSDEDNRPLPAPAADSVRRGLLAIIEGP